MSPLLKAVGVGLAALVGALLLMWLTARIMHRSFLPQFPQRVPSPSPLQLRDLSGA